ncbi:hypothetical protein I6A60_07185 [Frankia sp. AgB1.9]|uniref:DUF6176 family protein n=1 Tax=unclassified Frankia TaxID=2632575 RepID=UPI0019332D28|nr:MULTISPECIES: DUF6176 family protein [unclassified Frankia]MBL7488395.1 hypothetical protein [Frankia sp. AgW1.1]MBL7547657.1 hypothetical protein [Frankia sp. AgB1.9]MBL7624098.1 hypothetical protein [Frankia sp. AgB1.8]
MKNPGSYALYKVKKGKLDQWLAWCETVDTSRRQEAAATLDEEGLEYEFFTTFKLSNGWYAMGASINDSSKGGGEVDRARPINREHAFQKRDCLEPVHRGDFSYFLAADERAT